MTVAQPEPSETSSFPPAPTPAVHTGGAVKAAAFLGPATSANRFGSARPPSALSFGTSRDGEGLGTHREAGWYRGSGGASPADGGVTYHSKQAELA